MSQIPEGYKCDSTGALRLIESIKPIDLMRDEMVCRFAEEAEQINQQLRDFKSRVLSEVSAFVEVSAQDYGVNIGGKKGNVTLTSYDGMYRVIRANQDSMTFDERLLAAKELIDQCLLDWASRPGVPKGLVVVANRAFRRNAAGEISVSRVMDLRSHEIDDERWKKAMDIIMDSIKVQASVTYLRIYKRAGATDHYDQIALDIAGV